MRRRTLIAGVICRSVLLFVWLISFCTAALYGASFSLSHFGFGPVKVETSLTILKTGSYLRATATNATDEPIEEMRLCLLAMGVRECLFEMWTTKPLNPGEQVSWDLSSRILPPNAVHDMTVLGLERLSRSALAQRTIIEAAALLDREPALARSLAERARTYDPANMEARDLWRILEERATAAHGSLLSARVSVRLCNADSAEKTLHEIGKWRDTFLAEFKTVEQEIASARVANTALQRWSEHRPSETLTLIAEIDRFVAFGSCAVAVSARLKGEISAWQTAQAADNQRQRDARAEEARRMLAEKIKSGEAGNLGAQQWLANAYSLGDGAPADAVQAVRWLRKAIDQNDPWAATSLAKMYLRGQGVPLSTTEAAKLLAKAADQGYKDAQYSMALLLQDGIGVPQDFVRAHMWANLAAAAGHTGALQLRDDIAKLLPPERLAAAQELAAAWEPRGTVSGRLRASGVLELISTGSGFAVAKDGYVITNHHVIDGCTTVRLVDGSSQSIASVIAADQVVDLALVKADHPFELIPAIRDKNPGLLEPVWAAGFPLNDVLFAFNITPGAVSSESGFKNDTTRLQHTAPTQHGNSGGPLLTRDGNIAGVVVEQLKATVAQNVNWAIKSSILRAFLDSQHVQYSNGPISSRPLEAAALADRARRFTVLLECWK